MSEQLSGCLHGKTVLITAAAQGIGRATTELFIKQGAQVWATDINQELLQGLSGCHTARLDVRNAEEVANLTANIGRIDVLFNCAGFVASGNLLESSESDWQFSFDLNVLGMVRLIKAVLPGMVARRQGSIINMSSVASSIKGVPNRCVYSTTKAAVIGMTKSVAADFVSSGIRCNAICPGTVDTPSLHERLRATGDYVAAWQAFTARQPMGRVGMPEEIAALALYLASDQAAFTTGQCHVIDGGWSI